MKNVFSLEHTYKNGNLDSNLKFRHYNQYLMTRFQKTIVSTQN